MAPCRMVCCAVTQCLLTAGASLQAAAQLLMTGAGQLQQFPTVRRDALWGGNLLRQCLQGCRHAVQPQQTAMGVALRMVRRVVQRQQPVGMFPAPFLLQHRLEYRMADLHAGLRRQRQGLFPVWCRRGELMQCRYQLPVQPSAQLPRQGLVAASQGTQQIGCAPVFHQVVIQMVIARRQVNLRLVRRDKLPHAPAQPCSCYRRYITGKQPPLPGMAQHMQRFAQVVKAERRRGL